MDGLTLLVVLAFASTLALAGARAVLGAVLHLMTTTLVAAPVQRSTVQRSTDTEPLD